VIDVRGEQIREHFLVPLYHDKQFTKLDDPMNPRMSGTEIQRDAEEMEKAILGFINPQTHNYGESLIIEIKDSHNLRKTQSISDSTVVNAPNRCEWILNWTRTRFTWEELRTRAEEDKGRGTFWITEMQEVMADVASDEPPRAMTSTFRGRGRDVAGKIFGPQLHHVQFIEGNPVLFHFDFYEVLVPELVRGPGKIGKVFNLLHVASRVRWEVLNPYLKLQMLQSGPPLDEHEKSEMIGKVSGSLRVIEMEARRHNIFDESNIDDVFKGEERALLVRMIEEREAIRDKILSAKAPKDYPELMRQLEQGLALNVRASVLLAERFLTLVREDQIEVERMLGEG